MANRGTSLAVAPCILSAGLTWPRNPGDRFAPSKSSNCRTAFHGASPTRISSASVIVITRSVTVGSAGFRLRPGLGQGAARFRRLSKTKGISKPWAAPKAIPELRRAPSELLPCKWRPGQSRRGRRSVEVGIPLTSWQYFEISLRLNPRN
jgi:hypothetical protein